MLTIKESHDKTHLISDYEQLLARGTDPIAAATTSFGDLRQLEDALRNYVQQQGFYFTKVPLVTEVDESAFKAQPLTASQSEALRVDFLAYNQRIPDANVLLEQVLKEDPEEMFRPTRRWDIWHFARGISRTRRSGMARRCNWIRRSYLAHAHFGGNIHEWKDGSRR